MQDHAIVQQIMTILDDRKALDIVALDIREHPAVIADYMVIASGRTAIQVRALTDDVQEKMSALGYEPLRIEGQRDGRWAIIDYGFVLVEIFHREEREYYNLERLWEDGQNRLPMPFETETK